MLPLVYSELHRMAASCMRQERANHTLQPTALVSETYLRLVGQHSVDFSNRAQLLGIAAQMMRRILATHEQTRSALKRGGGATLLCLQESEEPLAPQVMAFSVVDEVLNRLAVLDKRQALVAELQIFGGLTIPEMAEFVGVSEATVSRDWSSGRLWLARELRRAGPATKG